MSSLTALAGKSTSGMPKMPKSHDPPLCAYLMRYDAYLQSHLRSSPKWYINQKKLKSNENNSSYRPDTKPMFIKVSLHIKFEGSSWKIDFRNAKNAKVTWPAIMRIFNEVWCLSSIPSKIFTQVIHKPIKVEIQWKQFRLSSGHQALMTEHPDSLRKA